MNGGFFISILLGRHRLLRWIFFAEFLPRSRLLFGMLDNFARHVSKGRPQWTCFTISRLVDRQLVSILSPEEIAGPSRRLVGGIDIETQLLGGLPIACRTGIAQTQYRPWPHPSRYRPAAGTAKHHVGITLGLIAEDADLPFDNLHHFHEGHWRAMAVFYGDNVRAGHKLLKGRDRKCNAMERRIVIDRDAEPGKASARSR